MNFSAVGPVLSREAKRITAEYEVSGFEITMKNVKETYLSIVSGIKA